MALDNTENQTPLAAEADGFQAQWDEFMGFTFEGAAPKDEAEGDQNNQDPPANGEPAPASNASPGEQQPQGEAEPPKVEGEQAPKAEGGEEIDPAALLAMATGVQPQAKPEAQAQPAATPEPETRPEEFRPFSAPVQLPPQTLAALFEAEDTETRAAAIGGVLQAMGNAIVQVMEARLQQTHIPAIQQAAIDKFKLHTEITEAQKDFYGTFKYLDKAEYRPIVGKAFEIIAAKYPDLDFHAAKVKVGNLAREFIKKTIGVDPAPNEDPPAPRAAAPAPAASKPPSFAVGGSRPAGTGEPADPNSPEAVLADMLGTGF